MKKTGKSATRRKDKGEFLERYEAWESYLLSPDRKRGVAGIVEGEDRDGNPVLIRTWIGGAGDQDLRAIWRNELRVLHRLSGAPGAEEHIARIVDAGEDRKGFHIALQAGGRRPLPIVLDRARASATSWLQRPSSTANRKRLWKNLQRLAFGLELLHGQGLIHCNLDAWSVLTNGVEEADFQLTGFEWSMRLTLPATNRGARREGQAVSFLNDWADFAKVAGQLLGITEQRLLDLSIAAHAVSEHVSALETGFLRDLLYPDRLSQIDGDYVESRIDEIVGVLTSTVAASEAKHVLILNLGVNSYLSRAIREASALAIEIDDLRGQRDFVRADLSEQPRILAVGEPDDFRLVLRGANLFYHLREFELVRGKGATSEFMACDNAHALDAWGGKILAAQVIPASSIEIMDFGEARERAPKLRGRVLDWATLRASVARKAPTKPTREQRTFQALCLLHAVELVLSAADLFPVDVVTTGDTDVEGEPLVGLRLRRHEERELLSSALSLRPMSERLIELLEREAISDDEGWLLSDAQTLGRRSATDVVVQYETARSQADGTTDFMFRVASQSALPPSSGYLAAGEFQGRITQFRRRADALRSLKGHTELLRMLSDPRGRIIETHEFPAKVTTGLNLDTAKAQALEELMAILPLYLVQGPPGVGKSYLVRELVRERLADEPSSRLLLTAQSHHAVDHLASEIKGDWKDDPSPPLAVRCRAAEDGVQAGSLEVAAQTSALISKLKNSKMGIAASPRLRSLLSTLAAGGSSGGGAIERRALDGLVMRAANLVFATTNSADLARLVEERAPFDWAIVEEAGKATGGELLVPLLLSHRRLMIGDHKQLPPFGSEKLQTLFSDPVSLRNSLSIGLDMIERPLKEAINDELMQLLDTDEGDAEFAALCSEASRMLFLFESMIEAETKRQKKSPSTGKNIARVLTIQHRMHPKLAELVSTCFYDGDIQTSPDAKVRFDGSAPLVVDAPSIPEAPIVVIDIPYQQSTMGKRNVERYPRFINPEEIEAVVALVRALRPRRGDNSEVNVPSLAVLSPYAKQVARLKIALSDDVKAQTALQSFRAVGRGEAFCSTVDAFQGNEADAVIVSFVRNNHHATLRKALGFLSDPRRMNVLLSRARWRIFIVTSLGFLDAVTQPLGLEKAPEAAFLRRFLETVDRYRNEGACAVVPSSKLVGGARS